MSLKIFHLITTIERGGAENQLCQLVSEQIKLGHEVTVGFLKGKPELRDDLRAIGAVIIEELAGLTFVKQVKRMNGLQKSSYSVIHTHLPRAECLVAVSQIPIPWITSRHNIERFLPWAPHLLSSLLSRLILRDCSLVIAISKVVRNYLTNSREVPRETPIEIIHYGHPSSRKFSHETIHQRRTSKQPVRIVSLSRLVPQKDLETLIDACKILTVAKFAIDVKIYGEGHLKESLEKRILRNNLEGIVRICGKTSNVRKVLGEADILVLTSRFEGFGLVLLEGMFELIPIVACANPTVKEVMGEDYIGLASIADAHDVARTIARLSREVARGVSLNQMSARLELFDPVLMAQHVDQVYEVVFKIGKND